MLIYTLRGVEDTQRAVYRTHWCNGRLYGAEWLSPSVCVAQSLSECGSVWRLREIILFSVWWSHSMGQHWARVCSVCGSVQWCSVCICECERERGVCSGQIPGSHKSQRHRRGISSPWGPASDAGFPRGRFSHWARDAASSLASATCWLRHSLGEKTREGKGGREKEGERGREGERIREGERVE